MAAKRFALVACPRGRELQVQLLAASHDTASSARPKLPDGFHLTLLAARSAAGQSRRFQPVADISALAPKEFFVAASILTAVGWVWFNYVNATFNPISDISAQVCIMVLWEIALYAVTGVPAS